MAQPPIYNESMNSSANRMVGELATSRADRPPADLQLAIGRPGRELCIYPASMGYDLQDELDFLGNRAMEPNIFFSGRFLAPAMPRLEDRQIRLALIRDDVGSRSRLRLLMPFSIEKPGFSVGASIIRVWSNPFGPLGTPLVDGEEAAEILDNLLEALAAKSAALPPILVLPDVRLSGNFVAMIKAIAISRNLPVAITSPYARPMLESYDDGETYMGRSIAKHHRRDMRRQWRMLEDQGTLTYNVARQPSEIRLRMEEFLALEASGWKGAKRSAMVTDRYQHVLHHPDVAAFVVWAREHDLPIVAVDNLEGSVPIESTLLPERCVLLFGQEGPGLSDDALAAADLAIEITQFGSTRSINASAAAAIVMHTWIVQHAAPGVTSPDQ